MVTISEESQYNWRLLDDPMGPWVAAGKRVSFKWYTNFLWDNASYQATPLWVKEAGALGRYIGNDNDKANDTWVAAYDDPIMLRKLSQFYKAMADHYKSTPVEFIELGSIGRVGEGASWEMGGIEATEAVLKTHIDLLRDAFPQTQLIIGDDHQEYACVYAKSKGYGVDDHSIGVGGVAGNAAKPGRAYNAELIGKHFHDGTAPIGLENDTWHQIDQWYLKQMVDARANYCRIHQKPSNLKDPAVQDILHEMNLKMGYRIQFPEVTFPAHITKGTPFIVKFKLANAGVGYCLTSYYPLITVKGENGTVVAESIANREFKVTEVKSSADNITLQCELSVVIPRSSAGQTYSVYLSMADKDKRPALNLPYDHNDGSKRYLIHKLRSK